MPKVEKNNVEEMNPPDMPEGLNRQQRRDWIKAKKIREKQEAAMLPEQRAYRAEQKAKHEASAKRLEEARAADGTPAGLAELARKEFGHRVEELYEATIEQARLNAAYGTQRFALEQSLPEYRAELLSRLKAAGFTCWADPSEAIVAQLHAAGAHVAPEHEKRSHRFWIDLS